MTAFEGQPSLPRYDGVNSQHLGSLHGEAPDTIKSIPFDLRTAEFHPAGQRVVELRELSDWRDDLNRWAFDHGFPATLNEKSRSAWDVDLGVRLLEDTRSLPEGHMPVVWSWIATYLLPHFIAYRWGWPAKSDGEIPTGRNPWSRFGSTDKNGLFMARQRVLVYGPELAARASEQEFQSIQYRPAFGIDQRVARLILAALVAAAADPDSNYGRQGSTRSHDADDVCVELRLINSLRPLCFVTDDGITEIVNDAIARLPEIRDPRKAARREADRAKPPSDPIESFESVSAD